ncbi:tetratricopeptide repeat protein [Aliikangiella coralliicola]|uniref:histidine kinase n=1 Tax=Aliikangiella coralliicola TaxID=2592383 RepID=A0A545UJ38_9GAMM|nr:tetratricopeptide repeat protein [Aliikangiella coralliicola]TQV89475.1 tetratricopeptide repeat protein [Aliikangiella coralliicola]
MSKPNIILLIFISLSIFISPPAQSGQTAQEPKTIESYDKELEGLEGRELLIKVRNITSKTKQNSPDIALHYFNVGLRLLESLPDDKIKSDFYHNAAWTYITKSDFDKAEKHAKISFNLGQKINNNVNMANASTALGGIYYYRGDTGQALNYFKKSRNFSKLANDHTNEAAAIHNIALIYQTLGDSNTAIEYMKQSRDLSIKMEQWKGAAVTDMNIAEVYLILGNFDKALPYYESSLKTHEKLDDTWNIAKVKSMLGLAYVKNKNLTLAQKNIQESIAMFTQIGDKLQLTEVIRANGSIYLKQEQPLKAIDEFHQALSIAEEIESELAIQRVTHNLANAYLKLNDLDNALKYSNIALKTAESTENEVAKRDAESIASKIYAKKNDFKNAYKHLNNYKTLNLAIVEKDITEKNQLAENRFQSAKKEKQIELLTKDNQLKALEIDRQTYERNAWISGLALLVFVAFFFIYRQTEKRKLIVERANLMAELVERKNQLLADVSHELRTPLTVLQLKVEALQHNLVEDVNASYESLMAKIDDINRLISDIYQLAQSDIGALKLDLTSNNCELTLSDWTDELSSLVETKGFEWHQKIQLPNSVTAKFDKAKIKQVVSNLIDNSIAYTDSPGKIGLSSNIVNNHLEIVIEDSSPGVEKNEMPRIFERLYRVESSRSRATGGSGLGLSICKSIVEAHKGIIFPSASELGGLAITIQLPLQA